MAASSRAIRNDAMFTRKLQNTSDATDKLKRERPANFVRGCYIRTSFADATNLSEVRRFVRVLHRRCERRTNSFNFEHAASRTARRSPSARRETNGIERFRFASELRHEMIRSAARRANSSRAHTCRVETIARFSSSPAACLIRVRSAWLSNSAIAKNGMMTDARRARAACVHIRESPNDPLATPQVCRSAHE